MIQPFPCYRLPNLCHTAARLYPCALPSELEARPARSRVPSTSSYAGRYRSSWVHGGGAAARCRLIMHSPESARHISALLNLSGTSPSGMPQTLPTLSERADESDGPRMSSGGGCIVECCRMDAIVGVSHMFCGVTASSELEQLLQQGWIRSAGLRKVL